MEKESDFTHLPFGKRVMCGNYYVFKHTRSITKKEMQKIRDNGRISKSVRDTAARGSLPVITVGTVADSWRVSFLCGLTMFNAIDEVPVSKCQDGQYKYDGIARINLMNIFNFWSCSTTTVGDEEFQADIVKAMDRYLERMSQKNKAPLSKDENDKVMKEYEERENHLSSLLNMSKEVKSDK